MSQVLLIVSLLVKNLFYIIRYVSNYVLGDKYCNIEIWFGNYMDFSVYE
jgi:hypothetical protein